VENEATLRLMRLIDEQFLETPWYGSCQMARHLRRNGLCVGRHRVRRLMTKMGLTPIYQHSKISEPHPRHKIHPYLLQLRHNSNFCGSYRFGPRSSHPIRNMEPRVFWRTIAISVAGTLRKY